MMYNGVNIKGEWDFIPQRKIFKYRGYTCEIVKSDLGHLCGYVKIPKSLHKIADLYDLESNIKVHGNITYVSGNTIGFDCSHTRDYVPVSHYNSTITKALTRYYGSSFGYRNSEYVTEQLRWVVDQMIGKYKTYTSK